MKNLLVLFLGMFVAFGLSAQNYKELATGSAADTLVASQTFSKTFKINCNDVPAVSVHVFVDSVSGTPSATATLYQSLDNVNWESTTKTATFSTGVDTTFILTDDAFYGIYGKIEIVGNATTQKSRITATSKAWSDR